MHPAVKGIAGNQQENILPLPAPYQPVQAEYDDEKN
jgi:hypothetical protein